MPFGHFTASMCLSFPSRPSSENLGAPGDNIGTLRSSIPVRRHRRSGVIASTRSRMIVVRGHRTFVIHLQDGVCLSYFPRSLPDASFGEKGVKASGRPAEQYMFCISHPPSRVSPLSSTPLVPLASKIKIPPVIPAKPVTVIIPDEPIFYGFGRITITLADWLSGNQSIWGIK